MRGSTLRPLLAALFTLALAQPAHAQYTIVSLGTLGGTSSVATALNARGDVVGYAKNAAGQDRAFLVPAGGSMQDLGTFGGPSSYAYGINSLGLVVGSAALGTTGNAQRAFIWNGTLQNLGALGGPTSVAYGINDVDDVVGSADTSPTFGNPHGFRWRAGSGMQDLGTLGGQFSVAFGISDADVIVGTGFLAGNTANHACRWSGGPAQDLGVLLTGSRSVATAVGVDGTIVGYSEIAPAITVTHGFVRPAGGGPLQDLGTLGGASSQALAISDAGLIVGWGELLNGNRRAAYRNGTTWTDLNTLLPGGSGWTLIEARGVNAAGQIVGFGVLAGDTLAYLLSPVAITGVGDATSGTRFAGAYPNPVRDRTQFAITMAAEAEARLELYDVSGRSVRTLVRGSLGAGRHAIAWDGRGDSGEALPAGLYLARFQSGSGPSVTRRVSLVH